MPVKINFNICDNSAECSGIAVCPTRALYWDASAKNVLGGFGNLCVNNSKCISCGNCVGEEGCPIGAIIFAKSENELAELTSDYETDIEKVESLFVERYGAAPIDESLCLGDEQIDQIIADNQGIVLIEEFSDSSIQCLLSSIPIESIANEIRLITGIDNILFYRCDMSDDAKDTDTLPKLKVYRKNLMLGQIEGYYSIEDKACLFNTIRRILS